MSLTFQKELFVAVMPELPELFQRHWEEVALDKGTIKLEPDWMRYVNMEVAGVLHMVTARYDGTLIGYYIALVVPHLHYRASLTAYSDIFYIHPDYREEKVGLLSVGYKLFVETEKVLKHLGVQKSYVMTKVHLPISMLLKRLKYRFIERIYTKLL